MRGIHSRYKTKTRHYSRVARWAQLGAGMPGKRTWTTKRTRRQNRSRYCENNFRQLRWSARFGKARRLFFDIDASKERLGAAVYQVPTDLIKPPLAVTVRPIVFLSLKAGRKHWPTELEVTRLAWVIRKARPMIESVCSS